MLKMWLFGTIGGVVAVAVFFFIADGVSGPLMATPPGSDLPEEVALSNSLVSTVLGAVVGLGLFAAIARFAARPVVPFLAICAVGLVLFGVITVDAAETTSAAVWLNILHVVAAIPIVGALVATVDHPTTSTA